MGAEGGRSYADADSVSMDGSGSASDNEGPKGAVASAAAGAAAAGSAAVGVAVHWVAEDGTARAAELGDMLVQALENAPSKIKEKALKVLKKESCGAAVRGPEIRNAFSHTHGKPATESVEAAIGKKKWSKWVKKGTKGRLGVFHLPPAVTMETGSNRHGGH